MTLEVTVEKLPQSRVGLHVAVPYEDLKEDFDRARKMTAGKVRLPGWRAGKVPVELAESLVGKDRAYAAFYQAVVPRFVNEALHQNDIKPLHDAQCRVVSFAPGRPLVLFIEAPVKPEVKLGAYKKIELWRPKFPVTPGEMEERLEELKRVHSTLKEKEGPVGAGDIVRCDIDLQVGDLIIDKAKQTDIALEMIPDGPDAPYTAALLGAKVKEGRALQLEPAGTGEATSKRVVHRLTVNKILERVPPQSDDELLGKLGDDFADCRNINELKERLRRQLLAEKEKLTKEYLDQEVLRRVVQQNEVDIPEVLVEANMNHRIGEIGAVLAEKGLTLEEHLRQIGQERHDFQQDLEERTREDLKTELVLDAIAAKENLQPEEVLDFLVGKVQFLEGKPAKKRTRASAKKSRP